MNGTKASKRISTLFKPVLACALAVSIGVSLTPLPSHVAYADELTSGAIAAGEKAEQIDISDAIVHVFNMDKPYVAHVGYDPHTSKEDFNNSTINRITYSGKPVKPYIFLRIPLANGEYEEYDEWSQTDVFDSSPYDSETLSKDRLIHAGLPADKFKVTYKNNVNAGTATVTIEGIGDYAGSVTKDFTIDKADAWEYLCKKYPKKMKAFIKKAQSIKHPLYGIPPRAAKLPKLPNVGNGFKISYTLDYGAFYKLGANGWETSQFVRRATKKETTVPSRKGTWAYKNHARRWINQSRIKAPKGCYYQYGNGYPSQQWRHGDITDGLDAKRLKWFDMGNHIYYSNRKINVAVIVKGDKNFSTGYFHQVIAKTR